MRVSKNPVLTVSLPLPDPPGERGLSRRAANGMRLLLITAALLTGPVQGEETAEDRLMRGRALFEQNCGVCHSLDLPKSQRLDRATWQWVVSDMVETFGASWIGAEEQALIIEYLAEAYGPGK